MTYKRGNDAFTTSVQKIIEGTKDKEVERTPRPGVLNMCPPLYSIDNPLHMYVP